MYILSAAAAKVLQPPVMQQVVVTGCSRKKKLRDWATLLPDDIAELRKQMHVNV